MNADSADRRPISTGMFEISTIWQPCQPFEAAQVGFAGTPRESPPQAGQTKKPRRLLAKCRPEENPRSRVIFPQFSLGNYHLNILERFARPTAVINMRRQWCHPSIRRVGRSVAGFSLRVCFAFSIIYSFNNESRMQMQPRERSRTR